MRKKAEEYIRMAAETYCLLLFVILPLYMRDGFNGIGDVKYQFFRNVSVMFCILISLLQLIWVISRREIVDHTWKFSVTDYCVLGYLAVSVLSFCHGMDIHTALWGFSGWYMGLFSQLLFVWIYFVLSRWGQSVEKAALWCLFGALAVTALGVLNRYGYDPLGVYTEMEQGTWLREHMLSTIGNQNWYCGYLSVAASAGFYFGYTGKGAGRALGMSGCLLTFLTVLTQGSESGYLIPAAMMAVLFVDALEERKRLLRFCLITLCCPVAALLGMQGISLRGLMLVEDGSLEGALFWKGWGPLFLLLCGAGLILYIREKRGYKDYLEDGKIRKAILICCGILTAVGVAVLILCQISDTVWAALGEKALLRFGDSWGNDRGDLWSMSWMYFADSPWHRKLLGAGPDCFSHALYSVYDLTGIIHPVGQWENAIYANAHNEWLNMLINQGIMGVLCYAGIFAVSFVRLWRNRRRKKEAYWGLLAIAGYCVHAAVSFQQTVSAPLIFAVLGMSEAILKQRADQGSGDLISASLDKEITDT